MKTERQARLEILCKLEKIFKQKLQGSNKLLKRSLIKMHLWQEEFVPYFVNNVKIISALSALSMTIITIGLVITGVFGGSPAASGSSLPEYKGNLKKIAKQGRRCHKKPY